MRSSGPPNVLILADQGTHLDVDTGSWKRYFDTKCREVRRQWTNEKLLGTKCLECCTLSQVAFLHSFSMYLFLSLLVFLSLLISSYPAWSWFWNVWIGIDRTNFSTPRFCGIDSNLGDLFRCVVKASLVSWDSNTSTLKQMTRRMATWGEWGAGSFWQSRVWTAHGCLWQAVQARLVDTHAFRFICHIFGGICVSFLITTWGWQGWFDPTRRWSCRISRC